MKVWVELDELMGLLGKAYPGGQVYISDFKPSDAEEGPASTKITITNRCPPHDFNNMIGGPCIHCHKYPRELAEEVKPIVKDDTPGRVYVRANSYLPIAKGTCIYCGTEHANLRFVFSPYEDDRLMCVDCGDKQDKMWREHDQASGT